MSNKLRCILIDDEQHLIQSLSHIFDKDFPQVEICGTANDIITGKRLIEEIQPDLVFLDIAMPVGSGFDLLEQLEVINFEIVFMTSYHNYALEALKYMAMAYLLKPIDPADLRKVIEKTEGMKNLRYNNSHYKALLENLNNANDKLNKKIVIQTNGTNEIINTKDIIRFEGANKYTIIHIQNAKSLISSYSIGKYASMLEELDFYLCHKSHLINLKKVVSFDPNTGVKMSNGSNAPIATRKYHEFLMKIKDF